MDFLILFKWFVIGFIAVNILKLLQIRHFYNKLKKNTIQQTPARGNILQTAFKKSALYFPIYYLLVWLTCSTFLFMEFSPEKTVLAGLLVGIIWWVSSLVLEMLVWVASNHRFKLSWKEMYADTQPWISLSYYAIIISPLILSVIFQ